jgi:hypothetical protein
MLSQADIGSGNRLSATAAASLPSRQQAGGLPNQHDGCSMGYWEPMLGCNKGKVHAMPP